jgi:hypothetical protein
MRPMCPRHSKAERKRVAGAPAGTSKTAGNKQLNPRDPFPNAGLAETLAANERVACTNRDVARILARIALQILKSRRNQ